ncbi:MAG: acylphosphatase [Thermoleophilia bacterium]|nr:acylphosphatase [Gaiellaceae bacterium]MDW8338950.1 acylphosphatase [Thermoleophilia bacterium]
MIRRRVIVSGRVQGVYFRDTVRRAAVAAGVAGWVRNNVDGTVEAVLEGADDAVERVLEVCRRGPPGARVDDVVVRSEQPEGLAGFAIH